ncbi:MAG: GxxExxY protein [Verrucomicrobia bacterium]|nr:GxxExxY protein [Verrucomicrobiota bacterium]
MPIHVATQIKVLTQEEFHALDERIMAVIFEVHNEFGRFLDEILFKREIAARCEERGIVPVEREVKITVTHDSFSKDYFMDLLFCHGLMTEAKTAEAISPAHRSKSLHYLFLTGMHHSKLVNLRPERVEHEFVSTSLTPEERRRFNVIDSRWQESGPESVWLKTKMTDLLHDWGAFLDFNLYREGITHFLGGPEKVRQAVEVRSGQRLLGHQTVHLLTFDTAFAISAVNRRADPMEEHLRRFFRHTALRCIQWVNLDRHDLHFVTLT